MIAEISAGLSSMKAAKDVLQAFNGVQTAIAVQEVKFTLQSLILDAQQGLFAAQEAQSADVRRIADLEQEIVRLKDWSAEKDNYELCDAGRGAMVYMPHSGMDDGQPPHWLCANCFNHGRKSLMQFKGQERSQSLGGPEANYGCDACKAAFRVSIRVTPERLHQQIRGAPLG